MAERTRLSPRDALAILEEDGRVPGYARVIRKRLRHAQVGVFFTAIGMLVWCFSLVIPAPGRWIDYLVGVLIGGNIFILLIVRRETQCLAAEVLQKIGRCPRCGYPRDGVTPCTECGLTSKSRD